MRTTQIGERPALQLAGEARTFATNKEYETWEMKHPPAAPATRSRPIGSMPTLPADANTWKPWRAPCATSVETQARSTDALPRSPADARFQV
jgi:hypothetical protein